MMKASAIAHPIQGLIKYHGLRDRALRIPFHGSISVCTGPILSHTTVERLAGGGDEVIIDGQAVGGRALERAQSVLDAIRSRVGDDRRCRVESSNDFPQYVGLGSSSSGFAALAVAAAGAYGLEIDAERLSEVARLGAGSACRSLTGGISEWLVGDFRSYSRCLLDVETADWRIVVPLVRHEEPTEDVHQEVLSSPLFEARVDYIDSVLREMREDCEQGDLPAIWAAAERDTLNLHAVTMTGNAGHLTWRPATVAVIHTVRRLRDDGIGVWFSIDTGATAYLNTTAEHEAAVAAAVTGIEGVDEILHLAPAGPAHRVDEHLF